VINLKHAWYSKIPIDMEDTGERIPEDIRRFARRLMASILSHWQKPDCSHIGMVLDSRVETIEESQGADTFGLWVNFKTLKMKEKDPKVKGCLNPGYESINIPLKTTDDFLKREGLRKKGLQVTEDKKTGQLWFGIYTDITKEAAAWRSQYQIKTPEVHLDFGLSVMLATNEGDLFGRDWLAHLSYYDRRITRFAAQMQRQGKKPKESKRYGAEVARLKGYIKTEVNRILNRIVELKRPGRFVVERLDFRNPTLSRRLNRIIQNCGRKAIKAKLAEIEEVLGVPTVEVNPAYSSQECSNCHYVDRRNRKDRDHFHCLWCGLKLHADVNGSRTTGIRRSDGQVGSVYLHRKQVLDVLVRRHIERWGRSCRIGRPGSQDVPIDPRFANPYFLGNSRFKEWAATGRSCDSNDGPATSARERASQKRVTSQLADVT
jgi:putative transposase